MKKAKEKAKITKDMLIVEVMERYPDASDYLIDEYGFHCIGCPLMYSETLSEGALVHGLDDDEIEKLIYELNSIISRRRITRRLQCETNTPD